MRNILIVGGGAIGLQSARLLARAGCRVTLVERGALGSESSWAGGGIVSPLYPWRYSPAVTALAHWSQDYYPTLGKQLIEEGGIDPEVQVTGLYWLDLDDEAEALDWARAQHRPLQPVPIREVAERLPALGGGFARALHLADVANVRNPRLVKALRAALQRLDNVQLLEHCPVEDFVLEQGRLVGVRTPQGELRADAVVIAAGAWSGELLAQLDLALPVVPVKGQMILFKCAPNFLPAMVLAGGRYAIPRRDGHVLIGSTLEHAGFDKTPTPEALDSLRASAATLLPALAEAEVVGHWAGLRPGSPEGIPFIGKVASIPGLWLNCGHFRNGLVLAPASCQLLCDLLLGQAPIVDPTPYTPVL
ncbi:glycine oxidase ThiO [Pseudomonas sp. NW5]|uniref:glycine oxidase ThiO n=1 Tax=Pseudomonas sp. NW5 TaxID=2934934 RepID=UPI0020219B80|nr:glycine oxidase ThiO [Pseudomonas sp. NW5]MCL7462789.1 glycine oxidase ThiO [Pseudomonas sp. NW5]